jgi:hypothetical protein
MNELLSILEDVRTAVDAAIRSVQREDISNALYNVDHAEIDLMRARNLTVSIFHHGESNEQSELG